MKAYRQLLWVFLLLFPLLWLVWPSGDEAGKEVETPTVLVSGKTPGAGSRVTDGPRAREDLSGRLPRRASDAEPGDPDGVDRILANDGISNEQAALQLRKLAMDSTRSTEDRLEALQHGLNLNAASFADFAQQKDLPSELASHYLHEMINHNDSPSLQIRSYMALIDHPDAEVAGLAKDMLALELGDEERLATREKLLVAAQGKLAKLAAEGGK